MRRNIKFIILLIKLKLQHMLVFRFNFLGAFLTDAIMFTIQLLLFNVIYSQVGSIGDWSQGQMIIFIVQAVKAESCTCT